jgi:hypothetical protein
VLDDEVVGAAVVVEGHSVLHAGAASAADKDAKRELRVAFLGEQFLQA